MIPTSTARPGPTSAPPRPSRSFSERSKSGKSVPSCPSDRLASAYGELTGWQPQEGELRAMTTASTVPDFTRFAIGFDERDRGRVHELIDQVIDSGQWTEGPLTERLETSWTQWNELPVVALSSWAGGALAALDFAEV